MSPSIRRSLLLIVIIGTVFGCKSDSTSTESEELPLGRFEGIVGIDKNAVLYEQLGGYSYLHTNVEDTLIEISLESSLVSSTDFTYIHAIIKSENMLSPGVYNFNNIEHMLEFNRDGFSGYYYSPEVGLGFHYYSESGTVTIESVSEEGIKGSIEGRFYYYVSIGKDELARVYTPIEADFNSIFWDESLFFVDEE